MERSTSHKNPSRASCEQTIRRILRTEVMENGANRHFKNASDFMRYFESLYPATDALTKQVQRAVKAMNMAKDEQGYFLVDKTAEQAACEKTLSAILSEAHAVTDPMENCETVFLACDKPMREYVISLLESSEEFGGLFLTIVPSSNGMILYTKQKAALLDLLNSLTI